MVVITTNVGLNVLRIFPLCCCFTNVIKTHDQILILVQIVLNPPGLLNN